MPVFTDTVLRLRPLPVSSTGTTPSYLLNLEIWSPVFNTLISVPGTFASLVCFAFVQDSNATVIIENVSEMSVGI